MRECVKYGAAIVFSILYAYPARDWCTKISIFSETVLGPKNLMTLEDVADFYEHNDIKKNLLKIGSDNVLLSALMCSKFAIGSIIHPFLSAD